MRTDETRQSADFAYKVAARLMAGAAVVAVAHRLAPRIAAHPGVIEGRKRIDRAAHVLRGRPIMYRLRVEDGTVHIEDDHARIDTVTIIGGPPRVAMTDVEAIFEDALNRARAVAHQPQAIRADLRTPPDSPRDGDA